MGLTDILLIIISSAGLIHGLAFAYYLAFVKKSKLLTNYLLAAILVLMALRIGKSVLLNFGESLLPTFILMGLAFLLAIGTFLRWYVLGMTSPDFVLSKKFFLELIPFVLVFLVSLFFGNTDFEEPNFSVVIFFGSMLLAIYLHLAVYIFLSFRILKKTKESIGISKYTKSQTIIFRWLQLLLIGLVIIWISFFLNIIEDAVPYIVGPVMYSVVIYYLSYQAFVLGVTDLDGRVFKIGRDFDIFQKISDRIQTDRLFVDPDFSLGKLGGLIGRSPQQTSSIINQYAGINYNDFINQYRIEEAKKLLEEDQNMKFTISSIAFDVGFNSLSSFNAAFKKFTGSTPSSFRKRAR